MSRSHVVLNFRGGPFDGQPHDLPLGKRGTLEFVAKGERGSYQLPKDLSHESALFLHWKPAQAAA